MYEFRWNTWNIAHIDEHGVDTADAEFVVNHPGRGFPRREANDKFRAWGQTTHGRFIQVVYIFDPPGVVFVIHARPLTEVEKHHTRHWRT